MTPSPPNLVNLSHSGDLGDVVYAIPVLRRLAHPAHLTLYPNPGVTRVVMDEANANIVLPLLNSQQGISADWKPTHDCDGLRLEFGVRRFYKNGLNLADIHSNWCGHDHWNVESPWFSLDKVPPSKYSIVVARSARYRNDSFNWKELYNQFDGRACFVGTPQEYDDFKNSVGVIDYVETKGLLEAAKLMAAADIFIGNQSCPRAVAEGLKVPSIVEQANPENTHFGRNCTWYANTPNDRATRLDADNLEYVWCRAASFRDLGKSVHNRTHLHELAGLCRRVRWIEGPAIEIGVDTGGSALVIAWCLQRRIDLCDSYEGLPEYVKLNTLKELGRDLRVFPNKIYPYHYPSVVPPNNDKYAFAHIDTGTNDGLKDVVYDLIPRMADGGIVAMGGVNESMLRTLKINIEVIELKNCGIVYHVVKR